MPTAKKTAGPAGKGQAMVKWDEKFAALAKKSTKIADNFAGGGNFVKLQGGQLQYQGAVVPGNEMDVVVIDHILLNLFYEGRFDSDNPTSPVCFAFGEDAKEMRPHEKSLKPQDDGNGCSECPNNEWGSADTGRGKACKNSARLALISRGDLEDVANAEVAYLQLPVTSTKLWAGHVRSVDETFKRPPLGVITNVKVVPDKDTQFKVQFKTVELIEDSDVIAALFERYEKVTKEIDFPYVTIEGAEQKQAAPKNRKFSAAGKGKR